MRYAHGQPVKARRWWIIMLAADIVIIISMIVGIRVVKNYLVQRDAAAIEKWCQTVECVHIDPATGIGTPAWPVIAPEDEPPALIEMQVEEI